MHLQSAHIRHFRSLDDVTVEFATPITVIVGANAVGKSNLVDCLRFVRDAVVDGLGHAITRRGGVGRIRQYSRRKSFKIGVQLHFTDNLDSPDQEPDRYGFDLNPMKGGNYAVDSEGANFSYRKNAKRRISIARDADGELNAFDVDSSQSNSTTSIVSRKCLFSGGGLSGRDELNLRLFPALVGRKVPFTPIISEWRFSAPHPSVLKNLSSVDKDTSLSEDGTNWASVLKALLRSTEGRTALDRINEAMRAVIPKYKDVAVSTVGSYLVPQFRFEAGEQTVEFDPPQLSDGTLRVFGILLALYQQPPANLLVIEEPEQSVHPGALAVLVDSMREVSEVTQIIVTTHSPQLVDLFKPEEIRVATMQDGRTHITPIAKNQINAVKQRLMSLAEFMQVEGLQPDLEP